MRPTQLPKKKTKTKIQPSKNFIYTIERLGGEFAQIFLYRSTIVIMSIHSNEEVAGKFETEPTARHAGSDLEKIGNDAFVQSHDAFLADDDGDGVPYGLVLVAYAGHGVDLEPSTEDVTWTFVSISYHRKLSFLGRGGFVQWICTCLCYCT